MTEEEIYLHVLGERLFRLRRIRGLTQRELSIRARVPYDLLGDQERGQRGARITEWFRIAVALDANLLKLLDPAVPLTEIVGFPVVGE